MNIGLIVSLTHTRYPVFIFGINARLSIFSPEYLVLVIKIDDHTNFQRTYETRGKSYSRLPRFDANEIVIKNVYRFAREKVHERK